MGACLSDNPDGQKDKRLNNELNKQKQKDKYVKKLLFLGSGGSGKSTLFKQLKKIHGTGFDNSEDRLTFVDHIHAQIIEQMKLAIECIEFLAEDELLNQYGDDYKKPHDFNAFKQLSVDGQRAVTILQSVKDPKLNDEIASACIALWKEEIIKDIYSRRAKMKIEDSSSYFWDKISEISSSNYIPNEEDILLVRYRTTGVIDQKFTIQKNTFHIFDVGGQKSERKKWIHCFEGVTAVIFVASLSCYDEVMFEDEGVNSMADQLVLFDSICNDAWFEKTSMILFLNKKDLFAQKLNENKAISLCPEFDDYEGGPFSFDDSAQYIKNAFVSKNKSAEKSIFTHVTLATDKNNVEKVFNDVQHIIIENSLMSAGLMGDFGEDDDDDDDEDEDDDEENDNDLNVM